MYISTINKLVFLFICRKDQGILTFMGLVSALLVGKGSVLFLRFSQGVLTFQKLRTIPKNSVLKKDVFIWIQVAQNTEGAWRVWLGCSWVVLCLPNPSLHSVPDTDVSEAAVRPGQPVPALLMSPCLLEGSRHSPQRGKAERQSLSLPFP